MIKVAMPDPRVQHHFPEAATLALLDAALTAAELALRVAHPAVDDVPLDPEHDIATPLLTAHLILSRCSELRVLLDLYGAALRRCVRFDHDDDGELSAGPF